MKPGAGTQALSPDWAQQLVAQAQGHGASEAAVVVSEGRVVEVAQRDGRLTTLSDARSTSLALRLFVAGRYSAHATSDLRPVALSRFIERAVAMTRELDPDPHRQLLDPAFYPPQGSCDESLALVDPSYGEVTAELRRSAVAELEAYARAGDGAVLSATGRWVDRYAGSCHVFSNGFVGNSESTAYRVGASLSVADRGERKCSESFGLAVRHRCELPSLESVGREAATRTRARLGQTRMDSGSMTLVVDARAVHGLLGQWLQALHGGALQQQRSFLQGKLGQQVGSSCFSLYDDPTLPRALASRGFDSEGFCARRRCLVEQGVLQTYLLDSYYASKLGMAPTGGSTGNLIIAPGAESQAQLVSQVKRGLWVTGWLGGNVDTTRGDFSRGVQGFAIENGQVVGPVGEMNLSGNHTTLWERLVAVGNDPWLWDVLRSPTLVFDDVSVSGR